MEEVILSAVTDVDGNIRTTRLRVHDKTACEDRGFPCVIHSPSQHHMADWPLNWRSDTGCMERICEHGVGHPDPDHMRWVLNCDPEAEWHGVHGCDSCCIPPTSAVTLRNEFEGGTTQDSDSVPE